MLKQVRHDYLVVLSTLQPEPRHANLKPKNLYLPFIIQQLPMLSEKLKADTKTNHQLLEKKLVAFIRSVKTADDYINLLSLFYSYFGGLEQQINDNFDIAALPDYAIRRKTVALANDLEQMGAPVQALTTGAELPAISNHFEALGALYVIEGSTLGGSMISKMMQQQLQGEQHLGLSFFNGYGGDTMPLWQKFKLTLDDDKNTSHEDVIIRSANETFLKFSQFFDRIEFNK
jgi:heme oxygenase